MHEMALAQGILAVVLDAAEDEPVRRVRVRVGALQQIVPDSLQFSFQLLSEGTPAFGGALEIKPVSARIRCKTCGAKSILKASLFRCKYCRADNVEIVTGNELLVDAVELHSGWRYRPKRAPVDITLDHLREHAAEAAEPNTSIWPDWMLREMERSCASRL